MRSISHDATRKCGEHRIQSIETPLLVPVKPCQVASSSAAVGCVTRKASTRRTSSSRLREQDAVRLAVGADVEIAHEDKRDVCRPCLRDEAAELVCGLALRDDAGVVEVRC